MLKKDIGGVLFLKILAIFLLWQLFFSHPIDHSLTAQDIAARFF
jgi:hypothetical protein